MLWNRKRLTKKRLGDYHPVSHFRTNVPRSLEPIKKMVSGHIGWKSKKSNALELCDYVFSSSKIFCDCVKVYSSKISRPTLFSSFLHAGTFKDLVF